MKKGLFVKMLAAGALLAGMVQAAPISLISTQVNKFDTSWQNIVGLTWEDADNDGKILKGQTITFTITMDKVWEGDHDYDLLKIWVGDDVIGAPKPPTPYVDPMNDTRKLKDTDYKFIMDETGQSKPLDEAKYLGDPKSFEFTYKFDEVGVYDIFASAMCSEDLSYLYGSQFDDKPSVRDWARWNKDTGFLCMMGTYAKYRQGETEKFQVSVTENVPEPTLLSLLGFGLLGLVVARRRK